MKTKTLLYVAAAGGLAYWAYKRWTRPGITPSQPRVSPIPAEVFGPGSAVTGDGVTGLGWVGEDVETVGGGGGDLIAWDVPTGGGGGTEVGGGYADLAPPAIVDNPFASPIETFAATAPPTYTPPAIVDNPFASPIVPIYTAPAPILDLRSPSTSNYGDPVPILDLRSPSIPNNGDPLMATSSVDLVEQDPLLCAHSFLASR